MLQAVQVILHVDQRHMASQDQVGDGPPFMKAGPRRTPTWQQQEIVHTYYIACVQKPAEERIPPIFGRFGTKFFGPMIDAIIGVADPCEDGVSSAGAVAAAKSFASKISEEYTTAAMPVVSRHLWDPFSLILAECRCTMCW